MEYLTDTLGFKKKQPENVSWYLNIINMGQNIINWISNNPYMFIFLIFICIFLCWFCYKFNVKVEKRKKPRINKTENFCRSIVEKLFNTKFPSIRPDWLNNPKTNKNLELDMYNENLKLAFEYDGIQHSKFNKFFHKSIDDFNEQKERDTFKQEICKKNKITLIRIPHDIPKNKIKDYIISECKKYNFL